MREHPTGAILQRDKKTYAIVPSTPVGLVTPDDLEALAGGHKCTEPVLVGAPWALDYFAQRIEVTYK